MEEAKADGVAAVDVGGGGGESGGGVGEPSSRVTSSFKKVGDRQVFSVELRPGETTIVSWKKLTKDANKAGDDKKPLASSAGGPSSSAAAASVPPSAFDPPIESGQPGEREIKEAAPVNSFSAVIEKIERLYMGKDSSDEEDPNEVPDDDQYDTEDSFIDDTELDEYFEVDHASIKYDGFFINRGKLECINKPSAPPNQQPKKRRRKDMQNGASERGEGFVPNKHAKVRKVGTMKAHPVSKPSSQNVGASSEPQVDMGHQNHYTMSASDIKKKSGEAKVSAETTSLVKPVNGVLLALACENKDAEKQRSALQFKNLSGNVKDLSGSSDALHNRLHDKVASAQHSGRSLNHGEVYDASKRTKEKGTVREVPDLNMPDGRHPSETNKPSNSHRKDVSGVRPKSSSLEKAIRDLEKLVAESKPPLTENLDVDMASQSIKRRLPSDVKLKLARVARLAQSNHGKISKELITRLMSILGDSVQLRTLKRHLKVMVSTGISAKQEKENRFQDIKKEVFDMIRMCIPTMELKVQEHHAGASDDFQDFSTESRGIPKRKYEMDKAMEDKICDLYDLYVDSLDGDTGLQVRKLYSELAELWPNGLMDNHGIKRAICRSKERRRALFGKHKDDQEKMKRKKALMAKAEEEAKCEGTSPIRPQQGHDKSVVDSSIHGSTVGVKPVAMSTGPARVPSPSANVMAERPKHEKAKINSSSHLDTRLAEASLPKKKIRRKPEVNLNEIPFLSEKATISQVEERVASYKPALGLQPAAAPSFKQSSL